MSTIANNVHMHQALSCSISDYLVPVLILTSISSLFLFSSNNVSASDSYVDNISLTVPISCSLGGTVNTEHTATLQNMTNSNDDSNYTNGIGKTTLTAFCNDINGFSIYAVGFTGDTDTGTTNNKLVGINTNSTIDTKVYSSGDTTSSWSMKVTKVANSEVSYLPNNMTITNSYDNWHIVPSTYDKVATYKAESGSSATDKTLGAKLETTYAVYIGHSQLADTYQGKVKYVLVNPYNATAPEPAFMQNATATSLAEAMPNSGDSITLPDERDNEEYTITNIGGTYWMTDNLRITGTLSADLSNFTGEDVNISAGSLTSGDSYTEARTAYDSTHPEYGAYYNYCAASAGTVCNDTAIANTDVDVCPSGWRLPLLSEMQTIASADGANWNTITAGEYSGGTLSHVNLGGNWWSAAANNETTQYYLGYFDNAVRWNTVGNKQSGYSIRCVFDSTYSIQYDGNGASNPNGMGTTNSNGEKSVRQIRIPDGTNVTLLASNFKRAGCGFVGWSTDIDAWTHFTDNDNTNDPIIYGPMEDVIVDTNLMSEANDERIITMYAVWVPAKKDGNNNPVYLQEWDDPTDPNDGCAALAKVTFNNNITNEKDKITVDKNSIIALTDKRDNMVYAVAKLADNNCWMIENLRLDDQYTMGQNQNDNTVTNESLAQGYGGTPGTYGMFVGLANSESANFSSSTTSNSVYKSSLASPTDIYDSVNNVLEDIGTTNSPGDRFPRYNNNNTHNLISNPTYTQNYANFRSLNSSGTYSAANLYSYGNYYTWAAAMANTNNYTSSSTPEAAGTSICPAGWHLPSSNGANKEFGTLSQGYGGSGSSQSGTGAGDIMSNRFRSFPNNFLYSGYFYSSSANYRGTVGSYWSRSASKFYTSYYLGLDSTILHPSEYDSKYYGRSARCLVGS